MGVLFFSFGMVAGESLDADSASALRSGGTSKSVPRIVGSGEVCIGEKAILSVDSDYYGAKYQWYRGGVALQGETSSRFVHVSGESAGSCRYYCTLTVADGNGGSLKIKTKDFVVKDIECCLDDEGNSSSRKLIWKNDFGTFVSPTEYYVWDYSDISEPKRVYHKSYRSYRYCLPDAGVPVPKGASKCGSHSEVAAGGHEVAAYISWNYGAKLGWAAMCGDGTPYGIDGPNHYFPDHTDQTDGTGKYGACLFVNADGADYSNNPLLLYKQEINDLCSDTKLTVRCFVNVFSDSKNPVRIKVVVYDTEFPDLYRAESDIVEKKSTGGSAEWVEVAVSLDQIVSQNLTFEIHDYAENIGDTGDDLLLDDIQVFVCSTPLANLFFDLNSHQNDMVYCDGDDVNLFVDVTKMITSYYKSNLGYLFQYNVSDPDSPDFKKNWVNLTNGAVPESSYKEQLVSVIEKAKELNPEVKFPSVYFRAVVGSVDVINNRVAADNYFNPNDPCLNLSISNPIRLNTKCPTCSEPQDPKISVKGGSVVYKGKSVKDGVVAEHTTVVLCKGEAATLSVNDVTGRDIDGNLYSNYTLTWFKDEVNGEVLSSDFGSKASDFVVRYEDVTEDGTVFVFNIHDNFENEKNPPTAKCDKNDTVVFAACPKVYVPDVFCDGDDIELFVDVTPANTALYSDNLGYLFQFNTLSPKDSEFSGNWKNLTEKALAKDSYREFLEAAMSQVRDTMGDSYYPNFYFRAIAGDVDDINSRAELADNAAGKWSGLAVSDYVRLRTKCCYEPLDPQILSLGGLFVPKGQVVDGDTAEFATVKLYEGESATLSSNDITGVDIDGNPYSDYTLTWSQGGADGVKLAAQVGSQAASLVVRYDDVTEEGTLFVINVHDNFETKRGSAAECDKNDTLLVVARPKITIPEFFTPDGDGFNDVWLVGNLEKYKKTRVQIFDRFGKLIADMPGDGKGWDGTYKDAEMPSTDYWYIIDIEDVDVQYMGHFTLVR